MSAGELMLLGLVLLAVALVCWAELTGDPYGPPDPPHRWPAGTFPVTTAEQARAWRIVEDPQTPGFPPGLVIGAAIVHVGATEQSVPLADQFAALEAVPDPERDELLRRDELVAMEAGARGLLPLHLQGHLWGVDEALADFDTALAGVMATVERWQDEGSDPYAELREWRLETPTAEIDRSMFVGARRG